MRDHILLYPSCKRVGETYERTEFLSKDRISVKGQIQLSVKRQIYAVSNGTFMQKNMQIGKTAYWYMLKTPLLKEIYNKVKTGLLGHP